MPILTFILNLSLISALLLAPAVLLLSYWYRRSITNAIMIWRRPESAVITIGYAITGLVFFIVGISCFFRYTMSSPIQGVENTNLRDVGLICMLMFLSFSMIYLAARITFVQIVTENGIFLNHTWVGLPDSRNLIEWEMLCDYYIHTDYPNTIFTVIYKSEREFWRSSIPVPAYHKENFERILDLYLDAAHLPKGKVISKRKFSEN